MIINVSVRLILHTENKQGERRPQNGSQMTLVVSNLLSFLSLLLFTLAPFSFGCRTKLPARTVYFVGCLTKKLKLAS